MKKINTNIILFIFFIFAIISGLYGECTQKLVSNCLDSFYELKNGNVKEAISVLKNTNGISTDQLFYHNQLVDIKEPLINRPSHQLYLSFGNYFEKSPGFSNLFDFTFPYFRGLTLKRVQLSYGHYGIL